MKKIGLIHYSYPPNIGGVEILLREHAKLLSEMDYDVTIITGSGEETNPKIHFAKIDEIQSILRFNPALYEQIVEKGIIDKEFYTLSATIKNKLVPYLDKLDTIIIHNMMTLVHNLAFNYFLKEYIKINPQKKFIFWTHDQTFVKGEEVLKEKEGVNLGVEAKKILIEPVSNAQYVVISETFRELLEQALPISKENIHIIPNGIDLKKFLEIDESIWKIVEEQQLLVSFPLVLSPVNIIYRKNLEYCLDVISYLKKDFPKIKYWISGQASGHRKNQGYYESLLKKIKELDLSTNVIFLKDHFDRSLENTEIHDLYDLSDIVLFFSKGENFGLPLIEAALTSTPAFVSNLKVFKEIGGENIFNIDNDKLSAEQTAGLIKKFLHNDKIIQLKKSIRQKYNLKTIIKNQLAPLL